MPIITLILKLKMWISQTFRIYGQVGVIKRFSVSLPTKKLHFESYFNYVAGDIDDELNKMKKEILKEYDDSKETVLSRFEQL